MKFPLLALAFLALPAARGDEWPKPVIREVFSHSRTYFVRILPGESWGDTVGFARSPKGPYATAEFYRRERDRSYRLAATAPLLNPLAPVDFFVTDYGVLITLDNWHNMGHGKVVVFYSPEGKTIRAYELSDLFTQGEIHGFVPSVSSIWWRDPKACYIREGEDTLYVGVNGKGAGFVFHVDGTYQYCETREGTEQCRDSNSDRKWQRR